MVVSQSVGVIKMGLKHLTLEQSVSSPEWKSTSAGPSTNVVKSGEGTNPLEDHKLSDLTGMDGSLQFSSSGEESDELDDVIIRELLSMDDDKSVDFSLAGDLQSEPNGASGGDLESFLANGLDNFFSPDNAPASVVQQVTSNKRSQREMLRERRKKDVHNMIERRRRYHINDRIKELATLLPKSWREEMKLNKGTILKASVDYVRLLHRNQNRIRHVIEESRLLKSNNSNMVGRITELENLLKIHRIAIPAVRVFPTASAQQDHSGYSRAVSGPESPGCSTRPNPKSAGTPNAFETVHHRPDKNEPPRKIARQSFAPCDSRISAVDFTSWDAVNFESTPPPIPASTLAKPTTAEPKQENRTNQNVGEDFMPNINSLISMDNNVPFTSEPFPNDSLFNFADIFLQ